MSESLSSYRRAFNYIKDAKITISASLGILAVNLMYGDALVIHSDDTIDKQMEMAFPSAFGTPDATGIKPLDFAGVTATTLVSFEAARRTTPLSELAVIGASAQIAGCGSNALIDQTGWITHATDSGSSAMGVAWATKFLLDHTAREEDATKKRRWKAATAVYAGAMTMGAYLLLGDDGKLDMVSHASALAIGVTAYKISAWRQRHSKDTPSSAITLI